MAKGLESYLESILDEVAEGIEIIDADGHYSFANRAAEEMFGPREAIIGRRFDNPGQRLTTPEGLPLSPESMPQSRVMRTGEPVLDTLFGAVLPDGRRIVLTMNAVPFRDKSGDVVGTLTSFTDVTKRSREVRLDQALVDIGAAVNSSFDFGTILQRALDLAVEALGCESGILFLREGSDWVMRYLSNLPEDMRGTQVPDELASFTTLTGGAAGAIAFNDAYDDERISGRVMRRFRIRSLLDVTLRVRGRDIGDVSFIHNSEAVPFGDEDVAFANKFGAIVALALEGSELYRSEQETARILQEALLGDPAPIEGIELSHAYRSGTKTAIVGGDFYDVFETNGRVAIVLGDVSGKGLAKATFAAKVKYTIDAFLMEGELPAQVVARTNRVIERSTDVSTFTTAFVGVLDTNIGALDYINAGGSSPLVLRSRGAVERLTGRSPMSGAFPQAQFRSNRVDFAIGDMLLLCTNGVTEARGAKGLFGEDRLVSLIEKSSHMGVQDLVDFVMEAVSKHAGGELSDDVAIVAVKRVEGEALQP